MSKKAKEVFISYSTKDSDTAFTLLEVLESYGLDCWIAPRNIPQGSQWAEEIDKAIQDARVFVVIVSSHSIESKQVPKEIALAVSACESIFPFRIDDTGLKGTFRYYLSDYQFTDATTDARQKMTELAEIICSSLGKPIPEKKPAKVQAEVPEEKPHQGQEAVPEVKKEPVAEEKPVTVPKNDPPKSSQANGKNPIMVGAIAMAALIVVILGVVLFGKGNKSGGTVEQTASAVQEDNAGDASEDTPEEAGEDTPEESAEEKAEVTAEDNAEDMPEEATEGNEEEVAEDNAEDTAEGGTETVSAEVAAEVSTEMNQTGGVVGVWKKIAYEDRGAATDVNTDNLFVLGDGTPYFSLEDGLSGSADSALTPGLLLKDSSKYDLTVSTSFENTFDGSISDKYSGSGFSPTPVTIDVITGMKEENPTGLTYEDCYPEQYYFVHLTGTYAESPVKKSDVDTWLVYKKQYPLLSERMLPALAGKWKDSMGNLWEFKPEGEALAFSMTDTDGNLFNGVEYKHYNANKDKKNFFEHVKFKFDQYETDYYSILAFDGQKLEMLDGDWNSFVLTREE